MVLLKLFDVIASYQLSITLHIATLHILLLDIKLICLGPVVTLEITQ